MVKRDTQGAVAVEYHTGGTIFSHINFYVLSFVASRMSDGNLYLDHSASYASAPINSEEDAREYGLREAAERWPPADGWSHHVDVKLVELKFEFGSKAAA